jgi:hypothetical protein
MIPRPLDHVCACLYQFGASLFHFFNKPYEIVRVSLIQQRIYFTISILKIGYIIHVEMYSTLRVYK